MTNPFLSVIMPPGQPYTGPSGSTAMGGMFPSLSINYTYIPGEQGAGTTHDGLPDGSYRTVVRTGDYDPSYLFLSGKFDAYTVTKGSDGYFTVDLTARPTPVAKVVNLSDQYGKIDESPINNCNTGNWLTTCEPNQAYRRYLLSSFSMVSDASQRDVLRGTWISTNASMFSLGKVDFVSGAFDVTAKGPHYVPTDFGIPGLTTENGREVNSAFFEMYVTLPTIAKMFSQLTGKEVTVDMAKQALANPSKIFEGTIDEATAGQVSKKVQQLTMTLGDAGLRVNFNLTHFSAPNPSLKIQSASAQQTLTVLLSSSAASTGTPATGTTPAATSTAPTGNYVKTVVSGVKATVTVTLESAGTFTVYRKSGSKLILVKKVSGRKGANKVITSYLKGYSFVVKDAKGKAIAVRATAVRFAHYY